MIIADIAGGYDRKVQSSVEPFMPADEDGAEGLFVTDDVFVQTYWPHIPRPSKKGLRMYFSRADESKLIGHLCYRSLGCLLGAYWCVVFIFGGHKIIQSPDRRHQRI